MTKLWLVSRTESIGYDEYDSMVVAADTEGEALLVHPSGYVKGLVADGQWVGWVWDMPSDSHLFNQPYGNDGWNAVDKLTVEYLGATDRDIQGVVLASFNAG